MVVLMGVLLFKQQKVIERCDQLQAITTQSFVTLTNTISAAEERLARENAAQHASLAASLEQFRSTQPAGEVAPVDSSLAMTITCNNGEKIELTNAHLISNGKSSEALCLRPDSFAFWLQIPWTRINRVTVLKSRSDTRPMGIVTLHDGTTHEYLIHSSEIRGETDRGQIQIAIPDVREIMNVSKPESN